MTAELNRRTFFKLFGVGAGAGLLPACTDAPVQHLYAYLTPPEEIVPGQATWYASVCRQCPAGCGLHVRTREARPVKLEGNPDCPVSRGALCIRGQAALNGLYHPDRLLRPLAGRPGHTQAVDPDEALAHCAKLFGRAGRAGAKAVGLVTGALTATSAALCSRFSDRLSGTWVAWELIQFSALKQAAGLLFDRDEVPRFDLSGCDFVLNLGADLFEAWQSPVEHARQFAAAHAFGDSTGAEVVSVGPRRDLTTVSSDRWVSVRPGAQGMLAMCLAAEVMKTRPVDAALAARLKPWIEAFSLSQAAKRSGCDLSKLKAVAKRLAEAERPVALPPGEHLLGTDATFEQAAVLLLNTVLGAIDRAVLFGAASPWDELHPASRLSKLLERAERGELAALILTGTNPAYTWPDQARVARALSKVPLVVHITELADETSQLAHVVLPASHFLEAWGDHRTRADWLAVQQPVLNPSGLSRQAEDWLIALAAKLGHALEWSDYRQCLAQRWAGLQQQIEPATPAPRFFDKALAVGGLRLPAPAAAPEPAPVPEPASAPEPADAPVAGADPAAAPAEPPAAAPEVPPEPVAIPVGPAGTALKAEAMPAATKAPDAGAKPWLLVYPSARLHDGRTASHPWLQEAPDSLTQSVWDTPVEIGPSLAARLGLVSGDRAEFSGAGGKLEATVRVLPGMRDDLVAMPLGGGRKADRYATGVGARAQDLMVEAFDPLGGGLAWLQTGVGVRKLTGGELLTVEGSPYTHGRPIVPVVSLADAKAGVFPRQTLHGTVMVDVKTGRIVRAPEGHPEPEHFKKKKRPKPGQRQEGAFYATHEFPEHMWGLTVDLDRCTGCGACVVACQAENNVATVGQEAIRMGREMHWLRIERYWGDEPGLDGPVPRLIPIMCQHCENAPCEPVCPVFAAYHTRDGLNAQIYNRCVGTRYCANNCPYKVRRFNWFDYEWPEPLNRQLNPDVTVRSAGVMEKCTMCVQRIREQGNLAKAEGRKLTGDEILPACAQTCPTGAIRFGDRKRDDSQVSKLAGDPRAYRLLDYYLNNRPAVTYLCKVDRSGREG